MDVNDLTSRAAKYDEGLARDIADYMCGGKQAQRVDRTCW